MNPKYPTSAEHRQDMERVLRILEDTQPIDRTLAVSKDEFQSRTRTVNATLQRHGHKVGIVFSDEHYCGDVPYLGGNINVSIEQVAGVVGPTGFHIVAGLEGGYVAEQLAERAGSVVHKVEMLQLADEKYPIAAERLEDVITEAAGAPVDHVALLTPRQVIPAGLLSYLEGLFGARWRCGRPGTLFQGEIREERTRDATDRRCGARWRCHVARHARGAAPRPLGK